MKPAQIILFPAMTDVKNGKILLDTHPHHKHKKKTTKTAN
jgi:hypothetical protein